MRLIHKSFFFIAVLSFFSITVLAQIKLTIKRNPRITLKGANILNREAINDWPIVEGGEISSDGKYAFFTTSPSLAHRWTTNCWYTFKSLTSDWCDTVRNIVGRVAFSNNSKYAYFNTDDKRLWSLELGRTKSLICPETVDFAMITVKGTEFLSYRTKDKKFVIENLKNKHRFQLSGVSEYSFSDKYLYYISIEKSKTYLHILNLLTCEQSSLISSEEKISNLVVGEKDNDVTCKVGKSSLFYFSNVKKNGHKIKIDLNSGQSLGEIERFAAQNKYLIIKLFVKDSIQSIIDSNPVKIFSYQDPHFYNWANFDRQDQIAVFSIYDIDAEKLVYVANPDERLLSISRDGKYAHILADKGTPEEYYWNDKVNNNSILVNLETGKRKITDSSIAWQGVMSSDGHFYINQLGKGGDILCTDTRTWQCTNLTADLDIPMHDSENGEPQFQFSRGLKFYNWTKDNQSIIVYDRYDIWQLDLGAKKKPVNLTQGVGRKNHTALRFIKNGQNIHISTNQKIIGTAFNQETKENGFFKMELGSSKAPMLFAMGPYFYHAPGQNYGGWASPVKARDSNVWLIPRQSAEDSQNLFWTNDFKTFNNVSNNYPEKRYQWFTTELVNFITKDSVRLKAVLYKPKNFDKNKKYPVLFNYYQNGQSDNLNVFKLPQAMDSYYFNYPMMVSQGYFVCLVDTYQLTGKTAHCLVDAIEGAGDELAKRSYINSKAYGAMGGSFGGYATNCLAALSSKFAALASVSGISDLVSIYGNVPGIGEEHTENRQMGMGVSLGSDPEMYLKNSPIYYAKNINTPLLIINTIQDFNVNVQQGIEFFISLRREGKRAWLLQYQETGHGIDKSENQYDLFLRTNQFFDHYLKGAPAPIWMTKIQSPNSRGMKGGFEYDNETKTPQPSQLLNSTIAVSNY